MDNQCDRERELFNSALERATSAERAAYLDGACGADHDLRLRVEDLLRANDQSGAFLPLDDPQQDPGGNASLLVVSEQPGDRIGPYKLREKVGEGGCGVVYVAEQEHPVRRRVALKVIKLGMDTKAVIARFEAERQALAMMEHPNIAKVLDAGATSAGRPYFVMELVRGVRITEYCDQNKLSTRARLDLFIKVCQAIQHAHQKGIIHRDIKPSNILVTMHDGVAVPKIIDFGIAKAVQGKLTDLTVYTDLHQFIGTPAYMSPEQAEMSGLDIDTRADIYSLGVLLYELLTGRTPLDAKELLKSGLEAMRRSIRETEPLRPSTRLSTMVNAELTAIAEHHASEPPRLVHLLRGDLDWIVMKALEKDRTRRYETANGLAMDIQRHLSNEPIVARPQSSAYRFQKLVRRNKLVFIAASAVCVALVAGLAGVFWQWRQAERNHQEAEANLYASDMNRAAQVLEDLGPIAARGLLEHHLEQKTLHGFEWRYLWKQCLGDAAFTFTTQSNSVWKLKFSPDGQTIAALNVDHALRLLDIPTKSQRLVFTNIAGLAGFKTNTGELVIGLREGKRLVALYAPAAQQITMRFPADNAIGWLPAMLDDGITAVLPGVGGQISLLDTASGNVDGPLKLPNSVFPKWQAVGEACAVSDNHHWVFSLDNGTAKGTVGKLSVREFKTGKILATYDDAAPGTPSTVINDRIYVTRFMPDGQTAIWASRDGYLHRWRWGEPAARPQTQLAHRGIIWDIETSPDGKWLATAGDDNTVKIWNAETLNQVRVLRGHSGPVYTLAFSPKGKWLASGDGSGRVKLWDLEEPGVSSEAAVVVARQLANRIIFTADGRGLAVGTDDDKISIVGTESGQVLAAFDELILPAGFTPDGSKIVGLDGFGEVATGKVEHCLQFPGSVYPWTHDVSPDGRWMVRSFRGEGKRGDMTEVLDLRKRLVMTNLHPPGVIFTARFSPDSRTILAAEGTGDLHWWSVDAEGLKPRRSVQVGHFSRAMTLSPDGATVALGGLSQISLVDYRTGEIRHRLFGHAHEITGLSFSPDGQTLASCSMDGTVKLWNMRIRQQVCTITFDVEHALGKEIGVQAVGFAPDGRSLWAFSRSGVLKCWRAAAQAELAGAQLAGAQ